MVCTIGGGLHDDAARDAKRLVHVLQTLPSGTGHFIGSTGSHRIAIGWAQHMKLTVDRANRRAL
jgi:hypothetical protein